MDLRGLWQGETYQSALINGKTHISIIKLFKEGSAEKKPKECLTTKKALKKIKTFFCNIFLLKVKKELGDRIQCQDRIKINYGELCWSSSPKVLNVWKMQNWLHFIFSHVSKNQQLDCLF